MEGMLEGFKDGRMDWKQIRKRKIGEIILLFLNTKVKIASGKLRMCIGGKENMLEDNSLRVENLN